MHRGIDRAGVPTVVTLEHAALRGGLADTNGAALWIGLDVDTAFFPEMSSRRAPAGMAMRKYGSAPFVFSQSDAAASEFCS